MRRRRFPKTFSAIVFTTIACLSLTYCSLSGKRDSLIDEPFTFEIKKNMMDDYRSIGTVLSVKDDYPLWKENIADCAFCMIKTVEYEDMTVRVFSFDVSANRKQNPRQRTRRDSEVDVRSPLKGESSQGRLRLIIN